MVSLHMVTHGMLHSAPGPTPASLTLPAGAPRLRPQDLVRHGPAAAW